MDQDFNPRAELEAAITAEFADKGQEATPPSTPEPVAAAPSTPDPVKVEPAPAPEQDTPAPLELTDKSMVKDPADGKVKPWGEIKAERLMRADYDRKRGAEAQRLREIEAQEKVRQAEYEAWKAKQEAPPELPEDENGLLKPFAQRLVAIEKQTQAYLEAQKAQERILENERLQVANERLDVQIKKVAEEFKLSQREIDRVGRETLARMNSGEEITLETVAKEYADEREAFRKAEREAAVKEFKEKHRVGSSPAETSIPATGIPDDGPPPPHTRARSEYLRDLLVGAR